MASYRSCFASANGWHRLASLPRAIIDSEPRRSTGSASRRSAPRSELCAFDADEAAFTTASNSASGGVVRFRSAEVDVHWATRGFVHDVKLLPGADAALALVTMDSDRQVVRLSAHAVENGVMDAPLPPSLCSSRDAGSWNRCFPNELLLSGPSNAYLLDTREPPFTLGCLDLNTGMLCGKVYSTITWHDDYVMRSACVDGEHTPHELTVAMMRGSESVLVHHDLRVGFPGVGAFSLRATGHAHVRRVRQGSAGTRTVLTSHSRSKSIEVWDLRTFGDAASTAGQRAPRAQPADEFRCAGNAPDMHCEHGIVAAISGGAPGTTYGAKLHIFSVSPRRLATECTLPEIVIDDGHRLGCPLGITLRGRTLTLMADRQRVLQCWVPRGV